MNGKWLRRSIGDTAVIFLHGILSDGDTCWRNKEAYWPDLLVAEGALADCGVYVFTYHSTLTSGSYSIGDAVDALWAYLAIDQVLASRKLVFVCHSMGGIVARRLVVQRAIELIEAGTNISLFLVASPSLGSSYASMLEAVIDLFGHQQADALRFGQSNTWLNDLDKDFLNLKEGQKLPIRGKELLEDHFFFLKRLFRSQVVPPFSGAKYFGDAIKIPGSDHSSIAKPDGAGAFQHRLLVSFLSDRADVARPELRRDTEPAEESSLPIVAPPPAASPSSRPLSAAIDEFLGGDPIRGMRAVHEMIAAGDEAEEALFSLGLKYPTTTQVYRRWVLYIRARHKTVADRLMNKLTVAYEQNAAALLMTGLPESREYTNSLYTHTRRYFLLSAYGERVTTTVEAMTNWDDARAALIAYGCAGGSAAWLWDCASGSASAWEKVRTQAFEGACYSIGRGNVEYQDSLMNFVRRHRPHHFGEAEEIDPSADDANGNTAVPAEELWSHAYREAFSNCLRGDVIDTFLTRWATHSHWRVRHFASQALVKAALPRLRLPFKNWIGRETREGTRSNIQMALFNVDLRSDHPEFVARVKEPGGGDANDLSAIVMLAKHGYRHGRIPDLLGSPAWFERVNGALAAAYLRDDRLLGGSRDLLDGVTAPLERVLLSSALAIARRKDCVEPLHETLCKAAITPGQSDSGLNIRLLEVYLQVAILDGLNAGATSEQVEAWKIEMSPVNP